MSDVRRLAAVVYEAGEGGRADRLLSVCADRLAGAGYRLAGTTQRAFERADRRACDMVLRDLVTNEERRISEDRGPHARGCRLDGHQLNRLVETTAMALTRGVDLLIINKFGKQEALGRGFRDVIAAAVSDGIPTVIGVNAMYLDSWRAFAGPLADELKADAGSVDSWLAVHLPRRERSQGVNGRAALQ